MSWHKKAITKYFKENVGEVVFAIFSSLAILLRCFVRGRGFEPEQISLISQPPIFYRLPYSALVFVSLGAFLYWIKFYKAMYWLIVKCLGDWRLYKDFKALVWAGLMLLMYFVIVLRVVELLNVIISFLYNVLNFILYLYAPLGMLLIIIVGFFIFKKYQKTREEVILNN